MLTKEQFELIQQAAVSCIEIELEAISNLYKWINEDFLKTVETIFESKGRLVVTGIGKSAIIGQKIVATFNSTGTPSVFMHAADAIHGDLGMIKAEDLVLCISKSGETPEIKVLIPLVKSLGSKLIAMVSNETSSLALQSDYLLVTPITQEADPNNLAPTASTTAQLVMGDAMAVALLALRGFSPNDFAQFHPGGSLGKQLYLKVKNVYPGHEKPKVFASATLKEVILEMTSKRLGVTAVLDANEYLIGIITDGDLRRMLQNSVSLDQLTAVDIMSANPKTVEPETLAIEAFRILKDKNINQLLVVENLNYLGVIHIHDLIKEGMI
ncbi:MAG: KpsF/GutQ family sugar-phosphate isomerase [Saprospiraceae bacterium]|nr:KpsF/GutQ family sugar-phosphate isomerase [Saprospiraceae bacterium]MBK8450544.1 KpsF/GutQ family sugar-phosphate isomerase [Saprospiraceae bacterium]MBK8485376.1 KpsF/GutQ family sugar-phosphate isomerase [Saprospiraceae bacterium]MBK9222592.1 KpsF/GutQ family sugar-phosphate isomerase [Saprospiraceae bacterium]MBK9720375.1 KpsF/GutQ family sugar-phosphate isomerase [Saprospiraceae bacterium]